MDDNTTPGRTMTAIIDTKTAMATIISFLPPPEMANSSIICRAMIAGVGHLDTIPQQAALIAIESVNPDTSNLHERHPNDDHVTHYANVHFCDSCRFVNVFKYWAWQDNIDQARQEGRVLTIPWDATCRCTKISKWDRCKSCCWGRDRTAIRRTYRTMWSHAKWGPGHRNNHPMLQNSGTF